jgi:hypothetical protein
MKGRYHCRRQGVRTLSNISRWGEVGRVRSGSPAPSPDANPRSAVLTLVSSWSRVQ